MSITMRLSSLPALIQPLLRARHLPKLLTANVCWGYSGEKGPENWAGLAPEFSLCSEGAAQSPIDLTHARPACLADIAIDYQSASCQIVNTGITIQVNVEPGSAIIYQDVRYDLQQFHFHCPGEHTLNRIAPPMEVHFVHQVGHSGRFAVVGAMLREGEDDNPAYASLFDNLPRQPGAPAASAKSLNLEALLPATRGYYTYSGSLTMPPCSENVRWLLLDTPLALSAAQIDAFRALYDGNARPSQPLGNRELLHHSQ